MDENIYKENGYADRDDYLTCLSEDYGVPIENVFSLAEMLGENEDFDGLVSVLEDTECMLWRKILVDMTREVWYNIYKGDILYDKKRNTESIKGI